MQPERCGTYNVGDVVSLIPTPNLSHGPSHKFRCLAFRTRGGRLKALVCYMAIPHKSNFGNSHGYTVSQQLLFSAPGASDFYLNTSTLVGQFKACPFLAFK